MSADNWAICPRCSGDFREDYEIGTDEAGEFYVYYTGRCRACLLEHKFQYAAYINLEQAS